MCPTAHCGRCKPHFKFCGNTSQTVQSCRWPQAVAGTTAQCCRLVWKADERKRCIIARFVATNFLWDNHFRSEYLSGSAVFVVGAVRSNCDWFRLNSLWITFRSELLWVQKDCTTLMKSGWTWLANAGQAGSLTRTGAWSTKSESVLFITMSNDFAIKHAVFHQLLSVPWFPAYQRSSWISGADLQPAAWGTLKKRPYSRRRSSMSGIAWGWLKGNSEILHVDLSKRKRWEASSGTVWISARPGKRLSDWIPERLSWNDTVRWLCGIRMHWRCNSYLLSGSCPS